MRDAFAGTLFRFPLRTRTMAESSEIQNIPYNFISAGKMLRDVLQIGSSLLLFLKHVENLSIAEVHEDGSEPEVKNELRICAVDDNIRSLRRLVVPPPHTEVVDPPKLLSLTVETAEINGSVTASHWRVLTGFGGGKCWDLVKASASSNLRLLPFGGVAMQVTVEGVPLPVSGRAFCFLPLPIETGLPLHVNGCFELSSNRRDLWDGTDMEGVGRQRVEWNQAMLEDVLAPLYARLIEDMRGTGRDPQALLSVWPVAKEYDHTWKSLSRSVLLILWDCEVPVGWRANV